jgi:hypothetical protein
MKIFETLEESRDFRRQLEERLKLISVNVY